MRRSVLIVEDDAETADALQEALEDDGFDVVVRSAGATAVATGVSRCFDIALIDLGLPDMDGFAVAAALRATPEGALMWILCLTARGDDVSRRRATEVGMDVFITKPIDLDDLSALLTGLPPHGAAVDSSKPARDPI